MPPGKESSSEDRSGRALARVMDADTDFNVYFNKVAPKMGKELLETNQKDGVDLNSSSEDPMFVDPENVDFRFKPGSPAIKMGIVPFDMSKVGLRY